MPILICCVAEAKAGESQFYFERLPDEIVLNIAQNFTKLSHFLVFSSLSKKTNRLSFDRSIKSKNERIQRFITLNSLVWNRQVEPEDEYYKKLYHYLSAQLFPPKFKYKLQNKNLLKLCFNLLLASPKFDLRWIQNTDHRKKAIFDYIASVAKKWHSDNKYNADKHILIKCNQKKYHYNDDCKLSISDKARQNTSTTQNNICSFGFLHTNRYLKSEDKKKCVQYCINQLKARFRTKAVDEKFLELIQLDERSITQYLEPYSNQNILLETQLYNNLFSSDPFVRLHSYNFLFQYSSWPRIMLQFPKIYKKLLFCNNSIDAKLLKKSANNENCLFHKLFRYINFTHLQEKSIILTLRKIYIESSKKSNLSNVFVFNLAYTYMYYSNSALLRDNALSLLKTINEEKLPIASYYIGEGIYFGKFYQKIQRSASVEYWEKAAKKGVPEAMWRLHNHFNSAKDKRGSAVLAKKWFFKCFDAGYYLAQGRLATINFHNKKYDEALKLYKNAVKMKHLPSCYNLAYMLEKGLGCQEDRESAKFYYEIAAQANMLEAKVALAKLMERNSKQRSEWLKNAIANKKNYKYQASELVWIKGRSIADAYYLSAERMLRNQKYMNAHKFYRKAALKGHNKSKYGLYYSYYRMLLRKKNDKILASDLAKMKVFKQYLLECAKSGYSSAQHLMGQHLFYGQPWMQKSSRKALYWLSEAIEQDHEPSISFVIENAGEYYDWLVKAAELGDLNSITALGVKLYQGEFGGLRLYNVKYEAYKWLNLASRKNSTKGMYYLGKLHLEGCFLHKRLESLQKALKLFTQSAGLSEDSGNIITPYPDSLNMLGMFYQHGCMDIEVEKNIDKAMESYNSAFDNGCVLAAGNIIELCNITNDDKYSELVARIMSKVEEDDLNKYRAICSKERKLVERRLNMKRRWVLFK